MAQLLGYSDLKPSVKITTDTVECPVLGCGHVGDRLRRGQVLRHARFRCPSHEIYISPSTFEYESELDNMLCRNSEDMHLWSNIHSVKRESRVARDNSEDALSWNVFRTLENQGLTGRLVDFIAEASVSRNPRLIYWSYCQRTQRAWEPLLRAAAGFGEGNRRYTEPDLIIDDDDLLIFVEAKLASGNRTMPSDASNKKRYESGFDRWFENVFVDSTNFNILAVSEKLYELMRLWLIGSLIANKEGKRFMLVNLVREATERDIQGRFQKHLRPNPRRTFTRSTWEDVIRCTASLGPPSGSLEKLIRYCENKALGYPGGKLRRAFNL